MHADATTTDCLDSTFQSHRRLWSLFDIFLHIQPGYKSQLTNNQHWWPSHGHPRMQECLPHEVLSAAFFYCLHGLPTNKSKLRVVWYTEGLPKGFSVAKRSHTPDFFFVVCVPLFYCWCAQNWVLGGLPYICSRIAGCLSPTPSPSRWISSTI